MIYTLIVLLCAFTLIMMLLKPSGVIYLRQLYLPAICIVFTISLILMSDAAVKAAGNGLALWAGVVVPSLFPFFAAAEIMNATGFIRSSGILLEPVMRPFFNVPGSASFALIMGVSSGYPVGAKITTDLRKSGMLTKSEAERLLAFTNNSGPLFIIGAVGTGMYSSPRIGIFLFICHLLACLTVGFLFRFHKNPKQKHRLSKLSSSYSRLSPGHSDTPSRHSGLPSRHSDLPSRHSVLPTRMRGKTADLLQSFKAELMLQTRSNIGTILGDAVKNSVMTILAIGGFIVLFSVIIQLLSEIGIIRYLAVFFTKWLSPLGVDRDTIEGILSGIFEITTGSSLVGRSSAAPLAIRLPPASFIIGWAGLSVHSQVMSIISKTDISIRPYLLGKFLQGIIAAIYTWAGMKMFRLDKLADEPVLGSAGFNMSGFFNMLGRSLWLLFGVLIIIMVIYSLLRLVLPRRQSRIENRPF